MAINLNQAARQSKHKSEQLRQKGPTEQAKQNSQSGWRELANKDIKLFGKDFSDKKRAAFYSELKTLLEAGVDLKTALELLRDEQQKQKDSDRVEQIIKAIVSGDNLSNAMQHSKEFSPYEYQSIRIGEESGKLAEVLKSMQEYYEKRIKQRRLFTNALAYPIFVINVAVLAVVFMLYFIVPLFEDVFARVGGELPGLTKNVIGLSDWIIQNILILAATAAVITIAAMVNRKRSWFRDYSSRLLLRLPIIGPITRKIQLARFCQAMTLLTGARVSLTRALDLIGEMIQFYPIQTALPRLKEQLLQGEQLHQAMSKAPIFENRMIYLLKVGEEVNQLDAMFARLAKQYTEEVESKTSLISSLLVPIVILLVGVLVAVILIAMYLPLFELSTGATGF